DVIVKLDLNHNPKFLDVTHKKSLTDALRSIGRGSGSQDQEQRSDVFKSTDSPSKESSTRTEAEAEQLAPFVRALDANLTVAPIPDTRTMKVSFTHTDPAIAAAIANGIAKEFIEYSFQNQTEKFTKASDWLDRSTRELKAKVEQAESALADYTRQHNIFSTDGKETLTSEKLARLHDQAMRAETDRILKGSLYE